MDGISIKTFVAYRSTFRLEKFLRRLYFKGNSADYERLNLNNFTQLQQLKIDISEYGCTAHPSDEEEEVEEEEYHPCDINISLPHLEVLQIDQHGTGLFQFHLTTPNLQMLKCDCFEEILLTHSDEITHLETQFYHQSVSCLKNVQYLKVEHDFLLNENDREILSVFPKLTTLACHQIDYIPDGAENIAIMETLRHIVEQKRTLKRSDLKIYFQSVELADITKYEEFKSAESDLAFQMNNYSSLCDNIAMYDPLDYNELMTLVNGKLPDDFFKKYFDISYVLVSHNVDSRDHLVNFLKRLKCVDVLCLNNISMDQSFYDKLDQIGGMTRLFLTDCSITNYEFLLQLKSLEIFGTDRIFPDFLNSIQEMFQRLKHFRIAHIYSGSKFYTICCNRGEDLLYKFCCYDEEEPPGENLIFTKRQLQFDQLVRGYHELGKVDWFKE